MSRVIYTIEVSFPSLFDYWFEFESPHDLTNCNGRIYTVRTLPSPFIKEFFKFWV